MYKLVACVHLMQKLRRLYAMLIGVPFEINIVQKPRNTPFLGILCKAESLCKALHNAFHRNGVLYVKFLFIVFEEQRDSCFPCDSCVQIKLFTHFNFDSIIAHYSVENKY